MSEVSTMKLWTGRVLSALPALLLLFSGVMKFVQPDGMDKEFERLGYSMTTAVPIGIAELAGTILYLVPRTSIFGAIFLTAYMGGATATHVRIGDPFFMEILMPILVGVMLWLGLYLREPRLQALVPLKKD